MTNFREHSDPSATVRLGPAKSGPADETVKLPPKPPMPGHQPAGEGTVRLGASQPTVPETAATPHDLAPELTPVAEPVAVAEPAPAAQPATEPTEPAEHPDGLRRFGPGVPPQAAAVWHGTAEPTPPRRPVRRRRRTALLPLLLVLALLGYLAWQRYGGAPTTVEAVTVSTSPTGPGCDGTAVLTGTLETDGRAGDVTYRWRRSDGTDSGALTQHVPRGRHSTDVVLRWTFQGHGTMNATATLEVLSPTPAPAPASASFPYTCP